jgi:hypothetical protein
MRSPNFRLILDIPQLFAGMCGENEGLKNNALSASDSAILEISMR